MYLNIKGEPISLKTPIVMGIVNCTDDSFYWKSRVNDDRSTLQRVEQHLSEGATFIDLGAVSTRPNHTPLDAETEFMQIKKYLKLIMSHFPEARVSIDTFRARIAEMAVSEGAFLINDISGGIDPDMFKTMGKLQVPYCLTHYNREKPLENEDLIPDMLTFFANQIEKLKAENVNDIILDPGFGFGKPVDQSYFLMKHLDLLHALELPLLVGISRKSMLYHLLDSTPDQMLAGTITLNCLAVQKGAHIIRVHDVKEAVDTIRVTQHYMQIE
jgi:dihydropteroate synthase